VHAVVRPVHQYPPDLLHLKAYLALPLPPLIQANHYLHGYPNARVACSNEHLTTYGFAHLNIQLSEAN
jgi:hypothetical protein